MSEAKREEPKKRLVPGDPLSLAEIGRLLYGVMRGDELELVAVDLRGTFRVGSETIEGSVSGGGGEGFKLYLSDSWEYRYLIEKEVRGLRIKSCNRVLAMFRDRKSGEMVQGKIEASADALQWTLCGMKERGS